MLEPSSPGVQGFLSKLMKNKTFKKYLTNDESMKVNGNYHICHSSLTHLIKGDMPPICTKNALEYSDIPECLKLTNLERQFIVKNLIFIKIRELPKTHFSHIFNSDTKFELLYERSSKVNLHVKYSAK